MSYRHRLFGIVLVALATWSTAAVASFETQPVVLQGVPALVYGNRVELAGQSDKTCVIMIEITAADGSRKKAYLAIPKNAASEISRFICNQKYAEGLVDQAEVDCALALAQLSDEEIAEMIAPLHYKGNLQFYLKSLKFGLARLVKEVRQKSSNPVSLFCRVNDQGVNMLVGFQVGERTYDLTTQN
ncbi:MAG: hypothetical protein PVF51_02005 [Nitrospirota bacterium]|jgi:hypothetical protein